MRALLLNHTCFYDMPTSTVAGVEVDIRLGHERSILIMPQVQQDIGQRFQLQGGPPAVIYRIAVKNIRIQR